MKMDLKLDILTLNCWGIVGVSRHRKQRMAAIANYIASSNYDFVFLQEIWSQDDYHMICKKTADVLPYSHYFYSGVIGSGVCILSKSCIVDTAQSQYSLNGYAHKLLHGDWYGGKVVGLCKVLHHGLKINLYVTHLHAEYDNLHDEYLPHRVAQAFEFSQFVQMTSNTADLSIVAGDFNTEPSDLPYQIIVHNAHCQDSFLTQKTSATTDTCIKTTCGHPDNLYTSKKEIHDCPAGKRIDYILYKCGSETYVDCVSCDTPLGKIPGSSLPYSDHEAVAATLHVFKSVDALPCEENPKARLEAIESSLVVLRKSLKKLKNWRLFYVFLFLFSILLLILVSFINADKVQYLVIIMLTQFIATLAAAFYLWMALIVYRLEFSALFSACKSMEILTNSLMNEYNLKLSTDLSTHIYQSENIL